ncbi:MAG TPA: hypothetical protein VFM82_07640 [Flavobacteriaceae bacterium]|nr:hypothetical protein [Flavobacteriaceae bacterium]
MPFDIVLAETQEFSLPPTFDPSFQSWGFSPASPVEKNYVIGGVAPSAIAVDISIQDYFQSHPQYDGFEVELLPFAATPNGMDDLDFLAITGDMSEAAPYVLDADDLNVSITIAFQNLGLLPEGSRTMGVRFKVYGVFASGFRTPVNSYSPVFLVNLNVMAEGSVWISPHELNFFHVRGNQMPVYQQLNVSAIGYWRIKHSLQLDVVGGVSSYLDMWGSRHIEGNGPATLQVSLKESIEDQPDGITLFNLPFYKSPTSDNSVGSIEVNAALSDSPGMFSNTPALNFFGIKGFPAPAGKIFNVIGQGALTATEDGFLSLSQNSGTGYIIGIATVPAPENFSIGVHQTKITVSDGTNTLELPATYEVVSLHSLNFQEERFYFTKENQTLEIYSASDDAFVEIELGVRTFDQDQVPTLNEYNYRLPIFNNRGTFKLGLEVHRLFNSLLIDQVLFPPVALSTVGGGGSWYGQTHYPNPAQVRTTVRLKNPVNETLLDIDTFISYFIKGHKPKKFNDYDGLLSYHNPPQRVTKNGVGIVNYANRNFTGAIRIKRNGSVFQTIPFSTVQNRIIAQKIEFVQFSPGDKIDIEFVGFADQVGGQENAQTKTYYVIPETQQSYHLIWVNECNVFEMMEFTGSFGFAREYENFQAETTDGFVSKLKNLESKKTLEVTCNTGFILKASVPLLDSLLASASGWLLFENEKIEVVPKTKKLAEIDTDQDLYSYDISFNINPLSDAEVYPS